MTNDADTRWAEPRMLVGGRLHGAADGATYPVLNPATGEEIGRAPDAGPADMDAAIGAARRAFDESSWSTDLAQRLRGVRQLHQALVEHGESMRALTTAEAGAPAFLTSGPQYDAPVEGLRWTADLAETYAWETELGEALALDVPTRRTLRRQAVGVVAAITSWSFPNQLVLAKIGPALLAGNTVVLKPAADTPWVACELARIAAEHTDLPPGVLNVVPTRDVDVAIGLTTDPRVDLVSFTGASVTGTRVMQAAAPTLKKVVLGLGGKSAAVVLDDADLATAVGRAAFSACVHAGQGAALTTRLVVPRSRYDEAVQVAADTMAGLPPADPTDPATVCGPVISAVHRDRVLRYLALAQQEGGSFVVGGGRPDRGAGFWVEPTLVTGLDSTARVAQEEVFGPVLVVLAHDGDDDAVRIANDSPYGLSGSVDGGDPERARAVARRIRSGTLSVNGGVWLGPDSPIGGHKRSGIGREGGVLGFEEYLETTVVAERIG